ncbi:histidine kinase dimerization/phospho-acceptor domain-containing protein [Paenibacillus larvae]|uniref:histidine kinase dimerization/phospho-acceptor domain-containing protein n=1 Tax=Paenibacillus larvae TaxID=1464 RepID=UPI002853ED32|nr:histidine kinase dimerization/phospho-acceptor domain-containing protein [Paenibacillus larvae]MDR5601219.1 histidine kinase dimerization/phospho-acceptor domain-containing protein [Paenibacillus larvae]MDV3431475.1 histidine kinase dimerization/phospho-acceptor domain-containing protein [Paenibacillus larvae]MDV3446578.1 histidine kinase dimerization/phospho-acceptor domain-containing protein [Paenibacillus larvae]
MITGVSHDLRTPLTSILGYLELIENDGYKDEVEFRYYTKIAYDKTIKLKKLIDDLFDYTSLHSKGPEFKMTRININGLTQADCGRICANA